MQIYYLVVLITNRFKAYRYLVTVTQHIEKGGAGNKQLLAYKLVHENTAYNTLYVMLFHRCYCWRRGAPQNRRLV